MAEVVGILSGGITLADATHKAGSAIVALKRLWNEVHNVPDYINTLLDRLSLLRAVLADTESELRRDPTILAGNSTLQQTVQYCNETIRNLDTLVGDLGKEVDHKRRLRRNKARIKVVLEQGTIRRLEGEINNAVQLLEIARQTHALALARQQPALIATQITNQIRALSVSASSFSQTSSPSSQPPLPTGSHTTITIVKPTTVGFISLPWAYSRFFGSYASKSSLASSTSTGVSQSAEETYCVRVQLPSWLARSVWDICAKRASNGWTYSLRYWTIKSQNAEVFNMAFRGNLSSIVRMFEERTASLYDRDTAGWTLLHYAAFQGNLEKFTYLVQNGLSIDETNNAGDSALYYLCRNTDQPNEVLSMYRFLQSTGDLDDAASALFRANRNDMSSQRVSTLHRFVWSVPGLLDIVLGGALHGLSAESRFTSLTWRYVNPTVLLDILIRERTADAEIFRRQLHRHPTSSLHEFAKVYFQNVPGGPNAKDVTGHRLGTAFEDWRALARWLFRGLASRDLSRQGNQVWEATTPLFAGLLGSGWAVPRSAREVRRARRRLGAALGFWLEDLRIAGVDLGRYGRWECRMFRGGYMLRRSRWNILACCGHDGRGSWDSRGPILESIRPAPLPWDWELVWDSFGEEYVGAFFKWAECGRPLMPGSWSRDDVDHI
ncbi:hypothetical protein BJY00DRAFT_323571 [Aspergillus carlsbadensis]|nr:hypothetical protein BJY00DRAFT_323571 [Aspergillus carlsbadensis]